MNIPVTTNNYLLWILIQFINTRDTIHRYNIESIDTNNRNLGAFKFLLELHRAKCMLDVVFYTNTRGLAHYCHEFETQGVSNPTQGT